MPIETQIQTPAASVKSPIEVALEDAEVLADYVASEAIPTAAEHVKAIAEARDAFSKGALVGPAQTDFYQAYAKLADAVRPVTVGSLRDTLDKYAPRRYKYGREIARKSPARLEVIKLRRWALAALLLLVGIQSYMLIGQNLLSAFPKLPDNYAEIMAAYDKQDEARLAFEMSTNHLKENLQLKETNGPALSDFERKYADLNELEHQRGRISGMLLSWGRPTRILIRGATFQFSEKLNFDEEEDPETVVLFAGRIIDVLQQGLPIFYGWLGAMAYVLRRIARETAERTYRADSKTGYSLRIWLGIVAGLAIGWFLRPEKVDAGGTVSISPFALAFVAGYSVDLLFTAMDRIVAAFSGTPAGSASAALTQSNVSGTKK